jgi:hypothetical protein
MSEPELHLGNDFVVRVTFAASTEPEDLRRVYQRLGELARQGRFHASIWDLRPAKSSLLSAELRSIAASCYEEVRPDVEATEKVCARVVANRALWGITTAFDWLVGGHKYPVKTFLSMEKAEDFVALHLRKLGLGAPGKTATDVGEPV